jgi:oligopeptide/dipeptide ABC transporter ATP-binding protein
MSALAGRDRTPDRAEAELPLLAVDRLAIVVPTTDGMTDLVRGVSFEVKPGQTLGLVGESGSGKSLTLRALLGLLPHPVITYAGAAVWRSGIDLLAVEERVRRRIRGSEIAMIFQDPGESLDPMYTVGAHLVEVLTVRGRLSRAEARERAVELLARVGIPAPRERVRAYPHQLSGGMRQRVVIALAIACSPALLLADEPTTALDVTIQDQILTLLEDLQEESGMAMILVSHDLGVVAQSCDMVAVMYAGCIVETGTVDEVLDAPRHPYTAALLASKPGLTSVRSRLEVIPGQPPLMTDLRPGCTFSPRCRFVRDGCEHVSMVLDRASGEHATACPMVEAHHEQAAR